MAPTPALADLLDRAYAVFGAAPPPRRVDACGHCADGEELDRMFARPLRAWTTRDVDSIVGSLGTTIGGEREVRHLAPRLVARLADLDAAPPRELIGCALRSGGWPAWPAAEVASLRLLLAAVLRDVMLDPDGARDVEGTLAAIAQFEDDIVPYLGVWASLPPRERSLALLRVLCALGGELRTGDPRTAAWWAAAPKQFAALRAFVLDPARLLDAADHAGDPALGRDAELARTWLDVLSRA